MIEDSVEMYLNSHCTRAASINQVKANTKKLLQIPSDPGMTRFHIHPPSRTVWANPSLQYVSSFFPSCSSTFFFAHPAWPCNSAWTIQRCLLQPLFLRRSRFFFLMSPPPYCVCQEHSMSAPEERGGVRGETQQDTLTRCGRDNHGDMVYPIQPPSPFSILIVCLGFSPLSLPPLYSLCISSTCLHICFSPGQPCAHHIPYFTKRFCFHLLYFAVHPPSVTALFLDALGRA